MTDEKKPSKTEDANKESDKAAEDRVADVEKRNDEVRAALKANLAGSNKPDKP